MGADLSARSVPHGLLSGFATGAPANTSCRSPKPTRPSLSILTWAHHISARQSASSTSIARQMPRSRFVEQRNGRLSPLTFSWFVLPRLLEGRCRGHETEGGAGQGKALHGRHDFARGGARTGSLRPIAGREAGFRDRRRHRAAVWPARTGSDVRSGNSGMGRVLRECCRRQTEGNQALALGRGREVDYPAAFALALSGDVARSRALADELHKSFLRIRRCNTCICRRFGPCSH